MAHHRLIDAIGIVIWYGRFARMCNLTSGRVEAPLASMTTMPECLWIGRGCHSHCFEVHKTSFSDVYAGVF